MCTSAQLFPTPFACHDCGTQTLPAVLAGVSVPLCVACLARQAMQAAGPSMVRAISLDLEPVAFEYVTFVSVGESSTAVREAVASVERAEIKRNRLTPASVVDEPQRPYRRPVPKIVSLTQDNGFVGNTLAKMIDGGGASPEAYVDAEDALDSLAGTLSAYDLSRLRIFMRGGESLPGDVADRVRKRVGLPEFCHLFGVGEATHNFV